MTPDIPSFKWYAKTSYEQLTPTSLRQWVLFLWDLAPMYLRFRAMYL